MVCNYYKLYLTIYGMTHKYAGLLNVIPIVTKHQLLLNCVLELHIYENMVRCSALETCHFSEKL